MRNSSMDRIINCLRDEINDEVRKFVNKIAIRYDLSVEDLVNLWENSSSSSTPTPPKSPPKDKVSPAQSPTPPATPPASTGSVSESSTSDYSDVVAKHKAIAKKLNVKELKGKLGELNLNQKATRKSELVDRLTLALSAKEVDVEFETLADHFTSLTLDNMKPVEKPVKKPKKAKKEEPKVLSMLKNRLRAETPQVKIVVNDDGQYEHMDTHFIFNTLKQVIGHRRDDGNVYSLTPEMINECKRYKFQYMLPLNLQKQNLIDPSQIPTTTTTTESKTTESKTTESKSPSPPAEVKVKVSTSPHPANENVMDSEDCKPTKRLLRGSGKRKTSPVTFPPPEPVKVVQVKQVEVPVKPPTKPKTPPPKAKSPVAKPKSPPSKAKKSPSPVKAKSPLTDESEYEEYECVCGLDECAC